MSQNDIADASCLKFYFLYNPNMLRVLFTFLNLHQTMSILYLYLFISICGCCPSYQLQLPCRETTTRANKQIQVQNTHSQLKFLKSKKYSQHIRIIQKNIILDRGRLLHRFATSFILKCSSMLNLTSISPKKS